MKMNHCSKCDKVGNILEAVNALMVKTSEISRSLLFKIQSNVSLSEELTYLTHSTSGLEEEHVYAYLFAHTVDA